MSTSQNGWTVISADQTARWLIPGTGRHLVLNPSHAGFVLAYLALWFHERVERLDLGVWDEWGWADRHVRGSSTVISNHASGTAGDLNATRHPLGVPVAETFTAIQQRRIRAKIRALFGVVVWGGVWKRPDGMHFEIAGGADSVRALARLLALTPRGRRVRAANPHYRKSTR